MTRKNYLPLSFLASADVLGLFRRSLNSFEEVIRTISVIEKETTPAATETKTPQEPKALRFFKGRLQTTDALLA